MKLRDDVNRTLASLDPVSQKEHLSSSPYNSEGDDIRTNLQRINAKIFEVNSEKDRQANEIEDLRRKLSEAQVLTF